jgi:hypothetical protein
MRRDDDYSNRYSNYAMTFEYTRPNRNASEPNSGKEPLEIANPYASTTNLEDSFIACEDSELDIHPASVVKALLVWSLVCTLSAAPSFCVAIGSVARGQVLAMVLGVVIFTGIYTYADLFTRSLPIRKDLRMRTILRSTFIVRSIMVILYPIALWTDMFLGIASLTIVHFFLGRVEVGFGYILITTLIQGSLLSGLLFLLGLLISAIMYATRCLMNRV